MISLLDDLNRRVGLFLGGPQSSSVSSPFFFSLRKREREDENTLLSSQQQQQQQQCSDNLQIERERERQKCVCVCVHACVCKHALRLDDDFFEERVSREYDLFVVVSEKIDPLKVLLFSFLSSLSSIEVANFFCKSF